MIRFISDVHLGPEEWGKLERFKRATGGSRELFLLGDIFEFWVGARHIENPIYAALAEHLLSLTRSGVPVTFVPGNRDFMVDRRFAAATGVRLEGRRIQRQLGERRAHLEHGDFIYNKNFKYFAYRRLTEVRWFKATVRESPRWVLQAVGKSMRALSKATTPYMHWSQEELFHRALPLFRAGNDIVMIGHIHMPQKIERDVDGRRRTLLILGDWDSNCDFAEFDGSEIALKQG